MPTFTRDNVSLNYRVLGENGPWVVLTPGGRGGLEGVTGLGQAIAADGYRVLLHDRRNCGASDVYFDDTLSEQEIWADDVHALLSHLGALPVIAGGGSAGCRLSLLLSLRYPDATRGLLLWYVTGGMTAATVLGQGYYSQYAEIAQASGMQGVCESPFFAERIAANPGNRDRLEAMSAERFVAVMRNWQQFFTDGADLPVIGATHDELASIKVPTCIIPGADEVHPRAVAEGLDQILVDSELHLPFAEADIPAIRQLPPEQIMTRFAQSQASIFRDFLRRRLPV